MSFAGAIANVATTYLTLGLANLSRGHRERYEYHFPDAGPVFVPFVPQRPVTEGLRNEKVRQLLDNATEECDVCELGRALHALQDSYAHGGTHTHEDRFEPILGRNGQPIRSRPHFGGHPKGRPLYGPNRGRRSGGLLDDRVDNPLNDPARYRAAQRDVATALRDFAEECNDDNDDGDNGNCP